jgi:hypothetical protein
MPGDRTRIGRFSFPTKKKAREAIRAILHSYPDCVPLVGADGELIAALLGLHHQADVKIGVGVDHLEVRRIEHGAPGFWIVRVDGTGEDFSYRRALDGPLNQRAQVIKAMRRAVQTQIDEFRRNEFERHRRAYLQGSAAQRDPAWDRFDPRNFAFNFEEYQCAAPVCPLTGLRLINDPTTHVDHWGSSFVELADTYADQNGGYDTIAVEPGRTHPGPKLAASHEIRFADYHRRNAKLRLVHRSANLARQRK